MPDNPKVPQHSSPGGDHLSYARLLRQVDLFAGLDRVTLSKLAARLQPLDYAAQSIIFRQGEPGDAFFLVATGCVGVYPNESPETFETRVNVLGAGEAFGEMALLNNIPRTATIKAETDCEVLRLERSVFLELVRDQPAVALSIAATLSRRLATMLNQPTGNEADLTGATLSASSAPAEAAGASAKRAGWQVGRRGVAFVAACAIFAVGWLLPPPSGLSPAGWHALVLLLVVLPPLVLNALLEGVLALLLACMWVVFGIAKSPVALSGFATPSWVLVVSALIIGAAVTQTGLLYRLALATVSRIRGGFAGEASALACAGLVLSPVVPNTTTRIIALGPMLRELVDGLGYAPKSNAAAGLAMAALLGFGQMVGATLTSGTNAVLVAALLPARERGEINWLTWTLYGAPLNLILFFGVLTTILWHYRPRSSEGRPPSDRAKSVALQHAVLGPMSRDEKIALCVVIAMLVGFITQSLHHLEAGWIAAIAVSALSAFRVVGIKTLQAVNWNFALLFGILTSQANVFEHTGVNRWVAERVAADMVALSSSRVEFVVVLALFCIVIRLILPSHVAPPLVTIAFAPVAGVAGIDPFIVGLISVVACHCFFLPYQSPYYLAFEAATGHALFTRAQLLPTTLAFAVWVLIAVVLSVPIWHMMGLM
jgi:anion transporter